MSNIDKVKKQKSSDLSDAEITKFFEGHPAFKIVGVEIVARSGGSKIVPLAEADKEDQAILQTIVSSAMKAYARTFFEHKVFDDNANKIKLQKSDDPAKNPIVIMELGDTCGGNCTIIKQRATGLKMIEEMKRAEPEISMGFMEGQVWAKRTMVASSDPNFRFSAASLA